MSIAADRSHVVFQKTERALLKLSSEQSAESVHTFRTTSRRLQTLLEQILPNRDKDQKKLLKVLGRIRKRAGKVRDIDVQLAALRSLKIAQEPRRKTLLVHNLIELRVRHEKKLRKLLTKKEVKGIRKLLKLSLKSVKTENQRDPLVVAKKMLSKVVRPSGPVTEDLLHQYRLVVKRSRYAAEFAPKSAESAQFIAQLKRLQDTLGNWHDWLTLTQTASARLGEVNQSSLVAALHNVTGGKFRQAVAALSTSPTIQASTAQASTNEHAAIQRSRKSSTAMQARRAGQLPTPVTSHGAAA
jgi:CHAD domain-containing protein